MFELGILVHCVLVHEQNLEYFTPETYKHTAIFC